MIVDTAAGTLSVGARVIPCAIGRAGSCPAADKREGDGRTPLGTWPLRTVLLRPDRIAPIRLALPWRWLRPDDGWCDAPGDPAYNRPIRHPYRASAERMWREDGLYDVVLVLGHNDTPPVADLGSAIFVHCRRDGAATEGCVALAKAELLALLPTLRPTMSLAIR